MKNDRIQIQAPASKSVSHRALTAAALADGLSVVRGALQSDDLRATRLCLAAMGAEFVDAVGGLEVYGMAGRPMGGEKLPALLDVSESGTTCRLLTGVAAAGRGLFEVRGKGRMHDRPMGELTDALLSQGVRFNWLEKEGYPPFVMDTDGLAGGEVSISLEESSQYLSGLLLAAPMAAKRTVISISGRKAVSWPYVGLTLQVLEESGIEFAVEERTGSGWTVIDWRKPANIEPGKFRFVVEPGRYRAHDAVVEGDWSNASYFLAAGAVGGKPVVVSGLRADSVQGDRAIADILAAMGARVEFSDGRVTASPGELRGARLDMGSSPDLVPTVAVVAAMAEGETEIRNVAHLRIKESDRLAALASELGKAGTEVDLLEDGLRILPRPLQAGREVELLTYGDHRIAMSMSILELAGLKVRLDQPGCVAKSFPGFWDEWAKIRQGQ